MEGLVQLVDGLYELLGKTSIKSEINLPEIVVVGDQSCGKSSLLQSIIMKDILPRGTGIVTRCPIRVSIRQVKGSNEFAVFSNEMDKRFNLDVLSKRLKEENDKRSAASGISLDEISVEIHSPNLVSLTLVDLPGIIQNVDDGQSTKLRDDIENLVSSRTRNPNTIIIAVCNSAIDLNNSIALRKAREVDPGLKRTLLVFTKMDLCQDPESVINPKIKTGLGHVGVRCRTEEEAKRGVKIEKQIIDEENFFNETAPYMNHIGLFGVKNLTKKIVEVFSKHVISKLPEIHRQIESIIERLQKEYESLPEYPNIANKLSFAQDHLHSYFNRIDQVLEGRIIKINKGMIHSAASIRSSFQAFEDNLSCVEIHDPEMSDLIDLYEMSKGLEGVPSISISLIKEQMEKIVKRAEKYCVELLLECRSSLEAIFHHAYNDLLKEFREFKRFIDNVIDKVFDTCFDTTMASMKAMLRLEYMTVECDEKMIDSNEQLYSLISNLWQSSQSNLARNIPKCIKFNFIQQVINLSKSSILKSMNLASAKDKWDIFPEIDRINQRKSRVSNDLIFFKKSKKELERFNLKWQNKIDD